ncbi:hypothetical protein BJ973_000084 [Actinoplanes tereljensis]|uniref:DUF6308 family protein n=1 Tax=Paractinoplanes tereljensis TaxID=571912 RepID=UPI0019434918|nr:DUF6308 family protein [Actinoplanes tereljensis]
MDVLREPAAAIAVHTYFAENTNTRYTGRRFDTLDGGGTRPDIRDRIAPSDLVAVQMLSVRVPAEVSIDLLDGQVGHSIADCLREIDVGVTLGSPAAAELIADGGSAERAWSLLVAQDGVEFVIAGKILARKRPHLIPVYDRVVRCQFGHPRHVWQLLHDRLERDDRVRATLAGLHEQAGLPSAVSLLRVLDVVLWMRHHQQHRRNADLACPGRGTVRPL